MKRQNEARRMALAALAAVALGAIPASAQFSDAPSRATPFASAEEAHIKGVIVSRRDANITIRDEQDAMRVITVGDQTEIKSPSGFLHMGNKKWDSSVLRPGLIVIAEGVGGNQGELVATEIEFRRKDLGIVNQIEGAQMQLWAANMQLKAAQDALKADQEKQALQISATQDSLGMTRDSLAKLTQQVASIDTYDERLKGAVKFRTGSAVLTPDAKAELDRLIAEGKGLSGYVVEIEGHTDAVGSASYNKRLSERRADAVVAYLTTAGVPARRVAIPTAMGELQPTATNATRAGRAENRRTEVKVLVSRGLDTRRNATVISSRLDR